MRAFILSVSIMILAGCKSLPPQQCTATARIGGQDTSVPVYGVRTVGNQTQYYAGSPFGWKWVSKNQFTKSTCEK
ncbi:phage exclusion lipoprotein Cor [Pantoea piersonii]|uniref:phage exclusion lipoprotein Cor n=1 Tax=Pantoea piersonii TaxID=2364647 RepID=UPI00406B9619